MQSLVLIGLLGIFVYSNAQVAFDSPEAQQVMEEAKRQSKSSKKEFDLSTLKCEHCHAIVEEMLQVMLKDVEDYQKRLNVASTTGDEEGKKFRMRMTGFARDSVSTPRMKKTYSEQFRDVAHKWADKFDWEISDTTFWFSKVFGESFAGSGISRVNPRHHIMFERKQALCHELFQTCPEITRRNVVDGETNSCKTCIALTEDLENLLARAKGKKSYRSREHVWGELGELCDRVGYNHEDDTARFVRQECDNLVDDFEDEIGEAFYTKSKFENIAHQVCVEETDRCSEQEFSDLIQDFIQGRLKYPHISGGIYPVKYEVPEEVYTKLKIKKEQPRPSEQPDSTASETTTSDKKAKKVKKVKKSEALQGDGMGKERGAKVVKKVKKVKKSAQVGERDEL